MSDIDSQSNPPASLDKALTGWQRRRKTTLAVKVGDLTARSLITMGGMMTIASVAGVCLFLVWVVVPLFQDAYIFGDSAYPSPLDADAADIVHMAVDDHQTIGYVITADGVLHAFRFDTGERVAQEPLFDDGEQLMAWSFGEREGDAVFGFADGSLRQGQIAFATRFYSRTSVEAELHDMSVGEIRPYEDGVIALTAAGQYRFRRVTVDMREPARLAEPSPVLRLSHTRRGGRTVIASYLEDGRLLLNEVRERENLLTGEVRTELSERELPFELPAGREAPAHVAMAGLGDNIYVLWADGRLLRYDLRDRNDPRVVEAIDLIEEEGAEVTAVDFLLGRHSLVVGDSLGRSRVWFRVSDREAAEAEAAGEIETAVEVDAEELGVADAIRGDGIRMVNAHRLAGPEGAGAVTALGRSLRSRMLSVGYADGTVRLYHVTSNDIVLEAVVPDGRPVGRVIIAPRDNGLAAMSAGAVHLTRFNRRHPEITWRSVFAPVWYEDRAAPRHMWQSSAATDDFEPKYGLVPLIFGTLKATFYSMLFGLPLALLAAIYTSEFLHRKVRARVKPVIEMMASLPSVVLGFVAALVIAPIVERVVPAVLLAFVTIPLAVVLGGYIWQAMPYAWQVRLTHWRVAVIGATVLAAAAITPTFGPVVEWAIFAGDIRAWLSGTAGSGMTGWALLLLPVSLLAVVMAFSWTVNPWMRERTAKVDRSRAATIELAKFGAGILATLTLAVIGAAALTYGFGWDPRGSFNIWGMDFSPFDTYEQRNALIVGFVMGFAIIPIIYTIAEDALSAVPEHLRSASLGAGATPWQTAARLIVPTAMSGLFSAAMIGLGRAAGETMIVLMAAGNTPLMEMNIFNGFRTLSANIAVELSEASVGGTHYRMLFLAALTLFALTFAINTVAEVVRLRFRKRAYQL